MRHADEVRSALADPHRVAKALGIDAGAKPQSTGLMVLCPHHSERTPSCSLTTGPDGTLRVKCFGCDWTADVIGLVAEVYGIEPRGDGFKQAVAEAARIAGLHSLADELSARPATPPRPEAKSASPANLARATLKDYPPRHEVTALWQFSVSVAADRETAEYLVCKRKLDPDYIANANLLRAIPADYPLPRWARYQGHSWAETGHRMICRLFDAKGECVSLRAWRVTDGESPKRLPPAGHRCSGHILANRTAVGMLLGRYRPRVLEVTEGEPDWATMCQLSQDVTIAVVGVGSGWWSKDIAARVPATTRVNVRTHDDEAGEKYAAQIAETLERCSVWRVA